MQSGTTGRTKPPEDLFPAVNTSEQTAKTISPVPNTHTQFKFLLIHTLLFNKQSVGWHKPSTDASIYR